MSAWMYTEAMAISPDVSQASVFLVVDHDPRFAAAYAVDLHLAGYRSLAAASSDDALERIVGDRPDAVLIDLHMHPVDGVELLTRIRRDERFRRLPVGIFTADPWVSSDTQCHIRLLGARFTNSVIGSQAFAAFARSVIA